MVYEYGFGLCLKAPQPVYKAHLVGVAADAGESVYGGSYLDLLVEELYLLGSVHDDTAQGAHGLIAHEEHTALRPP